MKLLVVFGSESDSLVYRPFVERASRNHNVFFIVASAHRDPDLVNKVLNEQHYDLVIAGAGLAAHLPGVIASKCSAPVFGIPISANFGGLDAFLSIVQMPSGVPVLAVAPGNEIEVLLFLNTLLDKEMKINLVCKSKDILSDDYLNKKINKGVSFSNIPLTFSEEKSVEGINIVLATSVEDVTANGCTIYVPMLKKDSLECITFASSFQYMATKGGVWVGVNNVSNAVLIVNKLNKMINSINKRNHDEKTNNVCNV